MTVPEGFWWGAGSSSVAAQGAAAGSDVAAWADQGGARPSGDGADLVARHGEDLPLLARAGLGHLRLTLDWTRLEPEPGRHDHRAVEELLLVLQTARDLGVSVWGCLHDGALPGWFAVDEHGFADARTRQYHWARHVEFVGETFGRLVHGWVPVFEPNRWAAHGWLEGRRPPGRTDDPEGFTGALEGILLASVDAALRLRQEGQPVATAHWVPPVFAARLQPDQPPTPDAEAMASVADEVHRGCWLRLLQQETLVVPGRSPISVPGAREAFDVIGVTYRHAVAVRGDGALLPYPQALPLGADGQVAWAEGLAVVLHRLAEDLPERPLLLAGIGLATADEALREDHLRRLLTIVEDVVADGIDLRGAWWSTPIDPADASPAARPGLFDADRSPRPAAALLTSVAGGAPVPR